MFDLIELISALDFISLGAMLIRVALILVISLLLLKFLSRALRRLLYVGEADLDKKETLISVLSSVIQYVVWAIALLLIIQTFDPTFNIVPVLAGAGVLGLAASFGAQNLIKDLITGFFIMFEDQIRVGDSVLINGDTFGQVEEIGLRMTALREWTGQKFYISNSEIRTISNYSRDKLRAIVTATFPFELDPKEARKLLDDVCEEFIARHSQYLLVYENGAAVEPPQVLGVTDIDQNQRGAQFTIITLTLPEYIWRVERIIREMIWTKAQERGIRLSYPRYIIEQ